MTFEDIFPEPPPSERYEHEIVRSGDVARGTKPRHEPPPSGFDGRRAVYRLVFKSMEVKGMPDQFRLGIARISQGTGPIRTQRTQIVQRPGWRPRFEKSMEHASVGQGLPLTVCELDVNVERDLSHAMNEWRDQALAAISLAVALFDERIAQEEIAEDLVIFDEAGTEPLAGVDHVRTLRTFQSANAVLEVHRQLLERLGRPGVVDLAADDPAIAAGRWYLRGAQLGPTADAVVYFWIALEALAKPRWGTQLTAEERSRPDTKWVELAVGETGVDPDVVDPTIGRLAGLRAEIVHGGAEQPALLRDGYYALERLVRLLLRHRFETGTYAWPLSPDYNNLRGPMRVVADLLHRAPQTLWVGSTTQRLNNHRGEA
jgi:hypothetical protein